MDDPLLGVLEARRTTVYFHSGVFLNNSKHDGGVLPPNCTEILSGRSSARVRQRSLTKFNVNLRAVQEALRMEQEREKERRLNRIGNGSLKRIEKERERKRKKVICCDD